VLEGRADVSETECTAGDAAGWRVTTAESRCNQYAPPGLPNLVLVCVCVWTLPLCLWPRDMTVSAECFRKVKWHYDYGLRSQVCEYWRFGTHCLLCPAVGLILSLCSLPNYTASHYIAHQNAPLTLFLSQKNLPIMSNPT